MKFSKIHHQVMTWFLLVMKHFAWCPIGLLVVHIVASDVFKLYEIFPPFDIPMHFFGGAAIAYFASGAYGVAKQLQLLGKPNELARVLLVFSVASTSTILWEFLEYTADHTLGTHMQAGIPDTMLDMLLGMLGGAVFLLFQKIFSAKSS